MHFSEQFLAQGLTYAYGLSVLDITGNGSLDIIVSDGNVGLSWFENEGNNVFTKHFIHQDENQWLERHAVGSLSGDGKPAIVSVDNLNGSILCFEYSGDPRNPNSWSYYYICDRELEGSYDVTIGDFNNDGLPDVAASSWRTGNQFVWFENRNREWIKHIIESDILETRTIEAADFTGNGCVDLLGTSATGNQIVWYENSGDPVYLGWTKHIIDTPFRPMHGHVVDMDGDGGVDVLMPSGAGKNINSEMSDFHELVWYEYEGNSSGEWIKHSIASPFPFGFEARAADLDGDGQMEVVATGSGPIGSLTVFKHQGDPRGPWIPTILKSPWPFANNVVIADLDGDGRQDIISCSTRPTNEVILWRNDG